MNERPQAGAADSRRALINRRRQLEAELQRLRGHLGGLTYEMAIRDHFRLDVLVRRAAILQERESELAEVERLLRTPGSEPQAHPSRNGGQSHRRGERR